MPNLQAHYPSTDPQRHTTIIKPQIARSERVDKLRKEFPLPTKVAVQEVNKKIYQLRLNKALMMAPSVRGLAEEWWNERIETAREAVAKEKIQARLEVCEESQDENAPEGWETGQDGAESR